MAGSVAVDGGCLRLASRLMFLTIFVCLIVFDARSLRRGCCASPPCDNLGPFFGDAALLLALRM